MTAALSGLLHCWLGMRDPSLPHHRYTLSGRDEKTLMKLLVHVETDLVIGAHM
jgi:hypothetical protein